jgi:hypothetical protein
MKALQRNLGHSKFSTTYNRYVHFFEIRDAKPADAPRFYRELKEGKLRDEAAPPDENAKGGPPGPPLAPS